MQTMPPTNPPPQQSTTKPRQIPGQGAPMGPQGFDPASMGPGAAAMPGGGPGAAPGFPGGSQVAAGVPVSDANVPQSPVQPQQQARATRVAMVLHDVLSTNPGMPHRVAQRLAEQVVDQYLIKEGWNANPLAFIPSEAEHGPLTERFSPAGWVQRQRAGEGETVNAIDQVPQRLRQQVQDWNRQRKDRKIEPNRPPDIPEASASDPHSTPPSPPGEEPHDLNEFDTPVQNRMEQNRQPGMGRAIKDFLDRRRQKPV